MKALLPLIVIHVACLAFCGLAGTTRTGDITAAIRDAGESVVVSAPGDSAKDMVNGKYTDRYLSVAGDMNPVTIDFDFGAAFLPGEDVVVTGLMFACGGNATSQFWGNHDKRMPRSWVLSGSNDGVLWTEISTVSGFDGYETVMIGGRTVYAGCVSFVNWKSYRQYRLCVSENTGNATYFLQLTEVAFLGLYGGKIKPPPELIDVSQAVRQAGALTCRSNAGAATPSIDVECVANGVWGRSDRYLSSAETTKSLLDAGRTIDIDFCIGEDFSNETDIVVTAYTIDVDQSFAHARSRLPKTWVLSGSNDGKTWTRLDAVRGFCAWETKYIADEATAAEKPHYNYTFKFVNTASYRQYRLSVSELLDRPTSDDMFQVSEIQLFGYVDEEIAGRVGGAMTGMTFDLTMHEETGIYAPVMTLSRYETGQGTDYGSVANLFDGLSYTFLLARLGVDGDELKFAPLTIGYEMNDAYLEGKEIVLKDYTLVSRTNDIGQYQERMPATWCLEGYVDYQWITLDARTNFNDWVSDESHRYSRTFSLPDNILSSRRYRLRIFDTHATASAGGHSKMHQALLYKIEMSGKWGTGISRPLPLDGATATWRCECDNVLVESIGEQEGKADVLRFSYPEDPVGTEGAVLLANYDLRLLLGSWIPPYVGTRARKLVCSVRVPSVSGGVKGELRCRANPSWIASTWKNWTVDLLTCAPASDWTEIEIGCELADYERLAEVALLFEGPGTCVVEIADPRILLDDGTYYSLVNGDRPSYMTGLKSPYATQPALAFPARPRIQFGIGQQWVVDCRDSLGDLGAYMKKYLPEYDIVLSLGCAFDPRVIDSMKSAPSNLFFQWQGGQHDLRYAELHDALPVTVDGRSQSVLFNSSVATHRLFQDAYEDQIAYLGTMGFNNLQRYDYVWYYPEGASGFDEASIMAFREDLLEKDEGLDLVADGIRPARRIHFWDYYEDYYGAPPAPESIGVDSWWSYRPKLDTPERERLHWTLVSYEWLRLAQRFGEWSEKYCFGSPYDFLLNGEFKGNGNDHVYLSRLRTSGVCSPEYFAESFKNLCGYYHGLGRYLRNARACGKHFGVTLETSRGGSGSQPYWSPLTGYALVYFMSALGLDGFEYDGLPGPCTWAEYTSGQNAFDTAELKLGMAEARAYRQAKLDDARPRPLSGIFHVCNRPVVGCRTYFCQDAVSPDDFADFRYELRRAEIDYTTTDPQELPEILGSAKVVLVSPEVRREVVKELLVPWSRQADHVLVTNKDDCVRWLASANLPRLQKPAEDGLASVEVLPFDCRQGSVAVLFNRKACAEADPEDWYERVWRPVVYKRTFNPQSLLYRDRIPGAAASAEVPVSQDGIYRVYRLISGREETVAAKAGYLRLTLGDDFTDVFYYGVDSEDYRAFLSSVKKERHLTADFFDPVGLRFLISCFADRVPRSVVAH